MTNNNKFTRFAFIALAALSGACGTEGQDGESTFGSGNTTVGEGASTDSGSENGGGSQTNGSQSDGDQSDGDQSDTQDSGGDGGGATKFDAEVPDIPQQDPVCDLNLSFIIDTSKSMVDEQVLLAGLVDDFIAIVEDGVDGLNEVNIIITTTSGLRHNCQLSCGVNPDACDAVNPAEEDLCDPSSFDECHQKRGSGVTRPVGPTSSAALCLTGAERYIPWSMMSGTLLGEKARAAALGCALVGGDQGSDEEWILGAMTGVYYQSLPGKCNDGFRIPGAANAFVILSDSDDFSEDLEGDKVTPSDFIANLASYIGDATLESVALLAFLNLNPLDNVECAPPNPLFISDKPKWLLNALNGVNGEDNPLGIKNMSCHHIHSTEEEYFEAFLDFLYDLSQACQAVQG